MNFAFRLQITTSTCGARLGRSAVWSVFQSLALVPHPQHQNQDPILAPIIPRDDRCSKHSGAPSLCFVVRPPVEQL